MNLRKGKVFLFFGAVPFLVSLLSQGRTVLLWNVAVEVARGRLSTVWEQKMLYGNMYGSSDAKRIVGRTGMGVGRSFLCRTCMGVDHAEIWSGCSRQGLVRSFFLVEQDG